MARWLLALVALLALSGARARKSPAAAKQHEPQIEEVTSKQLERVLEEKDFVAVYWCRTDTVAVLAAIKLKAEGTTEYQGQGIIDSQYVELGS